MNAFKKSLAVGAAMSMVSLSAACSGGGASSASGVPAAGKCMETIKERGFLRVGTTSNLPLDAIDTASKKLVGVVPEVLNAFSKDSGLAKPVQASAMPFSSLIPAINSNKIDITSDTMFQTPEREKQINFTGTLMYNPEGLVVKKGNPKNLQSLEKLTKDDSVATYQGTVWVGWISELKTKQGVTTQIFPGTNELVQAVGSGQTDSGLMSSAIAGYMIQQNPNLGVELAADYQPRNRDGVATHLGLHKNCTDLKDAFDKWYQGYVADGRMTATLSKWGVEPANTYLDGVQGYVASK
jgi:polar amino acid transport system substrate-binding protein